MLFRSDVSFIDFRTLYGPMNLGMSLRALCFGKAKFLSISIPNHLFGILCWLCSVYWNSAFALFCVLELHHAHLADSIQLAVQTV